MMRRLSPGRMVEARAPVVRHCRLRDDDESFSIACRRRLLPGAAVYQYKNGLMNTQKRYADDSVRQSVASQPISRIDDYR